MRGLGYGFCGLRIVSRVGGLAKETYRNGVDFTWFLGNRIMRMDRRRQKESVHDCSSFGLHTHLNSILIISDSVHPLHNRLTKQSNA
jgi:hypothetical protein